MSTAIQILTAQKQRKRDIKEVCENILLLKAKTKSIDYNFKVHYLKYIQILSSLLSSSKGTIILVYLEAVGFGVHGDSPTPKKFHMVDENGLILSITRNKFFGHTIEIKDYGSVGGLDG